MHIVNAADATRALPFAELVDSLRAGFVGGCHAPERRHHTIAVRGEPDATLLTMPAWDIGVSEPAFLGVKLVTVFPGNMARHLPGLESVYVLFNGATGETLALIDGNTVTVRRTAATAALAARCLSREDAHRLLIVGAGRVGSLLAEAYRTVRPIDEVTVWDINESASRALVARLSEAGVGAKVAVNLEEAVHDADIISAATLATEPLVKGRWVRPGTHIDLIGSFTPAMREGDDELIRRAQVYIDTPEAAKESGDILGPLQSGAIAVSHIRGVLKDLCSCDASARASRSDVTVFKTVGSALADLVTAKVVYTHLTTS